MYKWAYKGKSDKTRILATPGVLGYCPVCGEQLVAKCGEVKEWHWSHKNDTICDHWWENKSPWHVEWQNKFPEDCQEVYFGEHIADIATDNIVIEFQKSPLPAEDIEARTEFYLRYRKAMRWVVNTEGFECNVRFSHIPVEEESHKSASYAHFEWVNPQTRWGIPLKYNTPVMFDFSVGFFVGIDVYEMNGITRWAGWWGTKEAFMSIHHPYRDNLFMRFLNIPMKVTNS